MSWSLGDLLDLFRREPVASTAYREGARNQICTMQSAWCTHDPATVVLAHADWQSAGKGMGRKAHDIFGADLCDGCHRWIHEGRSPSETKRAMMQAAIEKTQLRRIHQGLLLVVGFNDKKVVKRG